MNSGFTFHQQRGHAETRPRFKFSIKRPENRGIDLAILGLVVKRVLHYTTTAFERHRIIRAMLARLSPDCRPMNGRPSVPVCNLFILFYRENDKKMWMNYWGLEDILATPPRLLHLPLPPSSYAFESFCYGQC